MKKILLFEDDLATLDIVKLILSSKGFETQQWIREKDAVTQVKEYLPDLLIIDIKLSGVDGRNICRKIQADPRLQNIPIILFSAINNLKEEALMCGVQDYIVKPFELNELVSKTQQLTAVSDFLNKSEPS